MSRIINTALIQEAIDLARPTVSAILNTRKAVWGPQWADIIVGFEGAEHSYTIGEKATEWNPEWGEELSIYQIARRKLRASTRTGHPTRHLVYTAPHLFDHGEYLYVGSVTWEGITVAVSGPESAADEAIALTVLAMIKMLIFLETERRHREGENLI